MVDGVVKRFGRLDILINDAAYNKSIPFNDLDGLTYRGVDQDHRRQPHRADALHQGGGAGDEEAGQRPHRQHRVGRGACAERLIDRLRGLQGRPHSSDEAACRSRSRPRCWSIASRPACSKARARPRIFGKDADRERRAAASLLKKAADKDDFADQVVTMCRTETMTGQTMVIELGPHFPLNPQSRTHANEVAQLSSRGDPRKDRRDESQTRRTSSFGRRDRSSDLRARARRDEAWRVSGRGLR